VPELDFSGESTCTARHGLHPYAARCPPQLVRYGVRYYSKPGDIVLDPMMGSGTTLVEAAHLKRRAIGFDIDPLARLIAEVKCCTLTDEQVDRQYKTLLGTISEIGKRKIRLPQSVRVAASLSGPHPLKWFSSSVAQDLGRLAHAIESAKISQISRKFFWVAFSSIILARTSVANARDIIHSRPHRFTHPVLPDVFERFRSRIGLMRRRIKESSLPKANGRRAITVYALRGDARQLDGIAADSVGLVFTSPPYATALDYPRAHFLAVAWMEAALGMTLKDYLAEGSRYVGSERGKFGAGGFVLAPAFAERKMCRDVLTSLASSAARQALLVQRYFSDMAKVLKEIVRVLTPGGHAVVVICPSHIRKVRVPTNDVLVELAREASLALKAQHMRTIDCRRRLLPYMDDNKLGARMSTEYVLIFQKPRPAARHGPYGR